MKRAQIRAGAFVGHDFKQEQWPIGDSEGIVFDAKDTGGSRFKCTVSGFGGIPYGNGPLFVMRRDLQFTEETAIMEEMTTLKEGFLAALKYLDPKMMDYIGLYSSVIVHRNASKIPPQHRADIEAIRKAFMLTNKQRIETTDHANINDP